MANWILAADSSRARIFEQGAAHESITEIEDYANPRGRADNRELVSDAAGRRFGGKEGSHGHAFATSAEDQVDHQVELFAKDTCEYLRKAHASHRYEKLWLIAPPKFLGLIRQNLAAEVRKAVQKEIPKEISWFDGKEMQNYLNEQLRN